MIRTLKFLVALAAAVLFCDHAAAARFPNAVERSFTLHGEAARSAAGWLGLDAGRAGSLSFRLGRGEAWAIYLLKQDTPEPLSNDNKGSPPRHNTLAYESSPKTPKLTLGPFWLDLGTRGPQPLPGTYSFSSGFLPAALEGDDAWVTLARRLRSDPAWSSGARPQLSRCVADDLRVELCLEIYPAHDYEADRDGHVVGFTIRRTDNPK